MTVEEMKKLKSSLEDLLREVTESVDNFTFKVYYKLLIMQLNALEEAARMEAEKLAIEEKELV